MEKLNCFYNKTKKLLSKSKSVPRKQTEFIDLIHLCKLNNPIKSKEEKSFLLK